jgi:hypothetical protein
MTPRSVLMNASAPIEKLCDHLIHLSSMGNVPHMTKLVKLREFHSRQRTHQQTRYAVSGSRGSLTTMYSNGTSSAPNTFNGIGSANNPCPPATHIGHRRGN